MSVHIDTAIRHDIELFGGGDLNACMNCGNCTAVCPLSTPEEAFPRKIMHYLSVGMKEKLLQSTDPWLCYYCGECSESCPREAQPGETMMAARRYLTSQYDWTGLSKKLYVSKAWEVGSLLFVSLIVISLFYFLHGPMRTDRVVINEFAPAEWVEFGDLVMAGFLALFLLSNAFRMFRWIMRSDKELKIPISLYIKEIKTFIVHFATQKRWRECSENKTRWLKHFLLVTGYLTMLTLVLVFLRWFQTDVVHPIWHPQRLLGYYATAVLLYFTVDFMISRRRKIEEIHKFTEPTDWVFLIMLFLTSLTGIVMHGLRITGFPLSTYYAYVIHLAIAVPMLVIEVPFSKWSHLLYRPLAVYLTTVKQKARELPDSASRDVKMAA